MVRKRFNKKGGLSDLVYIMITLLAIGLMLLIFGKFSDEFNTKIQERTDVPTAGKVAVGQINDLYGGVLDNSFLFLTIGLCIAALIMALLVVIHPVFFVFYFIFLVIVIYVSGALSNIYQTAAAEPELASIAAKLIFTSNILNFLPMIIGVFGFILAVIMYKTWENQQ